MGYFQTPWHIVLALLIALLLFGGKRLPEIGRSLGSGIREFKDGVTGHSDAEQRKTPPAEAPELPSPGPRTESASSLSSGHRPNRQADP
jgi:sec-independent protein translocase protein TatA